MFLFSIYISFCFLSTSRLSSFVLKELPSPSMINYHRPPIIQPVAFLGRRRCFVCGFVGVFLFLFLLSYIFFSFSFFQYIGVLVFVISFFFPFCFSCSSSPLSLPLTPLVFSRPPLTHMCVFPVVLQ